MNPIFSARFTTGEIALDSVNSVTADLPDGMTLSITRQDDDNVLALEVRGPAVFEPAELDSLRAAHDGVPVPGDLWSRVQDLYAIASDAARRTVSLALYMADKPGDKLRHLSSAGLWLSADDSTWFEAPTQSYLTAHGGQRGVTRLEDIWPQVSAAVAAGRNEPGSHELLREAWGLREESPRSALVLGMAAAETGVRELVAAFAPAADYWIKEAPSPPLAKLLAHQIPKLPVRGRFAGCAQVPKALRTIIQNGSTMRNNLVHRGDFTMDEKLLDELLIAVEDLLLLFEAFQGDDWPLEHLTPSVRASLGLATGAEKRGYPSRVTVSVFVEPREPPRAARAPSSTGLSLHAAARHEAGHAVIAFWSRFGLLACWIDNRAGGYEGQTQVTDDYLRDVDKHLAFLVGGWTAEAGTIEQQEDGTTKPHHVEEHGTEDERAIHGYRERLTADLPGWTLPEFEQAVVAARRQAEDVVARETPAVTAAAAFLADRPKKPLGEVARKAQAEQLYTVISDAWTGDRAPALAAPALGADCYPPPPTSSAS